MVYFRSASVNTITLNRLNCFPLYKIAKGGRHRVIVNRISKTHGGPDENVCVISLKKSQFGINSKDLSDCI